MVSRLGRRSVAVALVSMLLLSIAPGTVAAQDGVSGTVIVEEGETVSSIDAVAGTIVIEGEVTGDVSGFAGSVVIDGEVRGDVDVATGNLEIGGTVEGDVSAGAGNVLLAEGGTVGGNFDVGAGNVQLDGTIDGDATVGAETITLGETAAIAGSLTYDGDLQGDRDAVAGDVTQDPTIGADLPTQISPLTTLLFAIYAFFLNLILGAILLTLFPRFSDDVAGRVVAEPLRTGLIGLGVLLAAVVLLVLAAISVVGLPLSLAGGLAFVLVAWIGLVYGRFAVGVWLLSLADLDNRWLALVVGLLVGAILAQVPYVGGLLNLVIFLLGFGALATQLFRRSRRVRGAPTASPGEEAPAG